MNKLKAIDSCRNPDSNTYTIWFEINTVCIHPKVILTAMAKDGAGFRSDCFCLRCYADTEEDVVFDRPYYVKLDGTELEFDIRNCTLTEDEIKNEVRNWLNTARKRRVAV